ncbi:14612_t:CDS:2 [Dentiscutata erythropus]|uniref:14612_t:CDS:1 n=1 Tax=Dentiscutata erythropus TaxID=1348616 RepID=A0A9N9HR82_9GLOM|nr:14612_t:CDS:2 [Dentiscutata erythropus]
MILTSSYKGFGSVPKEVFLELNDEEKEILISTDAHKVEKDIQDHMGFQTKYKNCQIEMYSTQIEINLLMNFIQSIQINMLDPGSFVEWIPFENFKNIKYKSKGEFGSIYTAEWLNGKITEWDYEIKNF